MSELKLTRTELAELRRASTAAPNKIRLALEKRHAKQYELAEAAGISTPLLSEIVTGKSPRLTLETARRISRALGACIEDIFPPSCVARRRKQAA